MKKIVLIMLFMMCQVLAVAKTAYVMVPERYSELYIIGMDESSDKYAYNPENSETSIDVDPLDYYDGAKLLKITTGTEKDVKLVVGYKYSFTNDAGSVEEKYIILASEEIDYDELHKNYKNGDKEKIIKFDGGKTYKYLDFPGHEVKENIIVLGTKVGDKRSKEEIADNRDEYDVPKNIVEKFYLLPSVSGQDVYMYAGISPNNSSDEFKVTDALNNVLISMKKEKGTDYINLGDESYGLKNKKEELNKNDKIEAKEGGIYLNDDLIATGEVPFKVTIRIKNKLTTSNESSVVEIDGFDIPFSGDTKNYNLSNVEKFEIIYSGSGNGFDFKMKEGENTDVDTGSGVIEENPPVYVVEGEGILYDASVIMTSGNDNLRKRISEIEINVIEKEKSFKIKSIKE